MFSCCHNRLPPSASVGHRLRGATTSTDRISWRRRGGRESRGARAAFGCRRRAQGQRTRSQVPAGVQVPLAPAGRTDVMRKASGESLRTYPIALSLLTSFDQVTADGGAAQERRTAATKLTKDGSKHADLTLSWFWPELRIFLAHPNMMTDVHSLLLVHCSTTASCTHTPVSDRRSQITLRDRDPVH